MKKDRGGFEIDYSEFSYKKQRMGFNQEQPPEEEYIEDNLSERDYYNDSNLYIGSSSYPALPYAKSKPKLKRSEIITAVALMITGFVITVLLTSLLAQGLNIGHLLGRLSKAEIKQNRYYAVQLGSYSSESQALAASQTIRQMGGAGYIVMDGSYRIIAAVYPEEEQAQSVMANAKQFSPEQYVIAIPEIALNFSDKKVKEIVQKCLSQFDAIYKRLYEHSIKLDKGQTTEAAVLLDIRQAYDEINSLLSQYEELTKDITRVEHIYIKTGLKNILSALKPLLNANPNGNLSSDIKYAYTKILLDYKDLASQIKR